MSTSLKEELLAAVFRGGCGPLHILNTTIIPWRDGASFSVKGCDLTLTEAESVRNAYAEDTTADAVVSHIGHQSTADSVTTLLCGKGGPSIAFSRAPWDGEGFALIFQLKKRGEEGRIYTSAELQELGAGFRLMRIVWS